MYYLFADGSFNLYLYLSMCCACYACSMHFRVVRPRVRKHMWLAPDFQFSFSLLKNAKFLTILWTKNWLSVVFIIIIIYFTQRRLFRKCLEKAQQRLRKGWRNAKQRLLISPQIPHPMNGYDSMYTMQDMCEHGLCIEGYRNCIKTANLFRNNHVI